MGAAGARAAQVLAEAGLRVVGVEAGGWLPGGSGWFARTLPRVRRAGDGATGRSGGGGSESAADSTTVAGRVPEPAPMVNAVGGSNHRSARQSYRLDLDAMPVAWPLGTAELVPFYERVEAAAEVRPSPPAPWTKAMGEAAASLDWGTIPAPVATAAPLGKHELGPLLASGALQVLTGTLALRLLSDTGGAVTGAEVLRGGERERVRARRVILAAHTFENVRLLLLSRCAAHPGGVGNSTGRVGAGFATHNLLLAHGHFPGRDLGRRHGAPGNAVAVGEFDRGQDDGAVSGGCSPGATDARSLAEVGDGFRGGSILQAAMGAPDPVRVAAATGLPAEAAAEVGTVWAQPEQLPRDANRLDLDPDRRDPLGRPLLLATHDLDAEDRRRADFLLARMEEWLRAAGASQTWLSPVRPNALSTHAYGGTAMGVDPATSVVDSFGAVHDAPGLFVLGASTFPTTGGRGPTLTIEALAWRTATRLAAELA